MDVPIGDEPEAVEHQREETKMLMPLNLCLIPIRYAQVLLAASLTILLIPVLLMGGCFYHAWQFDHLEERAKRVTTAAELQSWATNLLAQMPTYSPSQLQQLRTNYPPKLRSVCPGACATWMHVQADYVMIIWSQKPSGDAALEIGSTNFVSTHPNARVWSPGVYFYRR